MNEKTLILSSGKCSWARCFACGWGKLEAPVDMKKCTEKIQSTDIENADRLKVFASGSFFDDKQFTPAFRKWFAGHAAASNVKEVVVESRPEYVTQENLNDFKKIKLTVAIGLESADNGVLAKYEKGFTAEDYEKAVELLHKNKMSVRTYLMVNIPFGSPEILDASVSFVKKHYNQGDSLVLINTFPHSKAKLFNYWIEKKWTPMNEKEFFKAIEKYDDNWIEKDAQNYAFVPKFPPESRVELKGVTVEVLNHPFFNVWQDYFQRFYKPPEKDILLFLPCSFKKPYSKSQTHKKIHEALRRTGLLNSIHKVVVSTPGVVPFEFCDHYPFNNYDWPEWEETPAVMEEYKKVNTERVKKFLEAHAKNYKKIAAFMKPSSETFISVKQACDELGINLTNLLDEKTYNGIKDQKSPITRPEALARLQHLADL